MMRNGQRRLVPSPRLISDDSSGAGVTARVTRWGHRWRLSTGPLVASVPWAVLLSIAVVIAGWGQGGDGRVYHDVPWPPDYSRSSIFTATYNYSPAFAFWVQPLRALPWEAFYFVILAGSIASLAYLVTPWIAVLLIIAQAPLVYRELLEGNLNLIAGALVVLGLRHGWAWAPMLLTKVTPGVGLVWFAVRREWRMLVIAAGATLVVALPALVLAPGAWVEWVGSLIGNIGQSDTMPLLIRGPLAVALVVWGARTDRPWTVALAVAMSFPANFLGWVVALGAIRLYRSSVAM